MKLMKAGGYMNGLKILNEARKHGLKTMIGCMIETTLGISSAMNICSNINYIDLDGSFIIKNEPFKLITENNGRLNFFNN
jgi:L-Ala-D/L-Glu epimerase